MRPRALIEAGADINKGEEDDWTALMFACQNGHDLCARALIEAGANKHATTKQGSTALSIARSNGHEPICKLLT